MLCDVYLFRVLSYYDNNKRDVKDPPLLNLKVRVKCIKFGTRKQKTFYEILLENNTLISRVQPYWQNKMFNNPIGQHGFEWHPGI